MSISQIEIKPKYYEYLKKSCNGLKKERHSLADIDGYERRWQNRNC